MPLSDEKLVHLMKSGATPHDIATGYGVPLTRAKSLFPYGSFDSFKTTCTTMFYRGQSATEIGAILACSPVLVRKCLSLTFSEEKMLFGLLNASDNGYTTAQIAKAFNIKKTDVVEVLSEFNRFSDTRDKFSWFKFKAARLNVDKWRENVYNLFKEEKWEDIEQSIADEVVSQYSDREARLLKEKLGVDIQDETDEQYIERTIKVIQEGTGLSKAAITRHAIHRLGSQLGVKKSGNARQEARKILIGYNLDVKNLRESAHATVVDELESPSSLIMKRTRSTVIEEDGLPPHLRGVSVS